MSNYRSSYFISDGFVPNEAHFAYAIFQAKVACPAIQSEHYNQLIDRVNSFSHLLENWDGYGGAEVSRRAIAQAKLIINSQFSLGSSLPVPEINPTPNGTVVIEWQEGRSEAAIEIGNSRVSGFVKGELGTPFWIRGDAQTLSEFLPLLVGPLLNQSLPTSSAITPVEYEASANG